MDKRHAYLFCKFLQTEMKKIDLDKYYEGIRIQNDPGQSYVVEWINKNAKFWREQWESSACQHCRHWFVCGHELKTECSSYEFDKNEEELNNG